MARDLSNRKFRITCEGKTFFLQELVCGEWIEINDGSKESIERYWERQTVLMTERGHGFSIEN